MTKSSQTVVLVFAFAVASTTLVRTQDKPTAPAVASMPAARRAGEVTPLKVQVVLSRNQGEKKISSLPYTLSVNANGGASLIGPTRAAREERAHPGGRRPCRGSVSRQARNARCLNWDGANR